MDHWMSAWMGRWMDGGVVFYLCPQREQAELAG